MTAPPRHQPAFRLARLLVVRTARRWPEDMSEGMSEEWLAELESLRADQARWRDARALTFAISLAISPAVEPEGTEPLSRAEAWARSLAASIGVTLLAAVLFNGVHVAQHRAGPAAAIAALAVAAALTALLARRVRGNPIVIGAALFAFLLAGNRIAIMPFMGWADVLPAVTVWTAGTAITARLGPVKAIVGALVTLDLAIVAGSLHAATSLGVDRSTAAAWFPLSLAPGGAVAFGPAFPGYQASAVLLGNASAMAGPMLLCSIFLLTRARTHQTSRRGLEIPLGVTAALAAQTACEVFRRLPPAVAPDRVIDNTGVFGFGFAAETSGQILVALVAGLLAAQLGAAARRA